MRGAKVIFFNKNYFDLQKADDSCDNQAALYAYTAELDLTRQMFANKILQIKTLVQFSTRVRRAKCSKANNRYYLVCINRNLTKAELFKFDKLVFPWY